MIGRNHRDLSGCSGDRRWNEPGVVFVRAEEGDDVLRVVLEPRAPQVVALQKVVGLARIEPNRVVEVSDRLVWRAAEVLPHALEAQRLGQHRSRHRRDWLLSGVRATQYPRQVRGGDGFGIDQVAEGYDGRGGDRVLMSKRV